MEEIISGRQNIPYYLKSKGIGVPYGKKITRTGHEKNRRLLPVEFDCKDPWTWNKNEKSHEVCQFYNLLIMCLVSVYS